MPAGLSQGNYQYAPLQAGTQTNTATFTVNPGPAVNAAGFRVPAPPTVQGVFYGVSLFGLGTNTTTGTGTGGVAQVVSVFDVIAPTGLGTNTATVTNLLAFGTASSQGDVVSAAGVSTTPPATGVRYNGALVVEISGALTLGTANCLFD